MGYEDESEISASKASYYVGPSRKYSWPHGKSAKDCYSIVCEELGWKEIDLEVRGNDTKKDNTIFCVTQTKDMLERLPRIGNNSWVSRYMGCPEPCEKGNFA